VEVEPRGDECGEHGTTLDIDPPKGGRDDADGIWSCECNECWEVSADKDNRQTCVDINECTDNSACGDHGTCIHEDVPCGWHCSCDEGFDCADEACQSCAPIDPCQGTPATGQKTWKTGTFPAFTVGEPASCGEHGKCTHLGGADAECTCDKCYEASEEAFECVEIDECEQGAALCQLEGDTGATCTDNLCGYSCGCTTGYVEVNGVCVDDNACDKSETACQEVDSTGSPTSEHGNCVDKAPPSETFQCYCKCGFEFNSINGNCESCSIQVDMFNGDEEQNGGAKVSNDAENLYIQFNRNSGNGLILTAVNINAGGRTSVTTQNDGREFNLDGTSSGNGECGPKPMEFGVSAGEFLHEVAYPGAIAATAEGAESSVETYSFTIPLDDFDVGEDCSISLMLYSETFNANAPNNKDVNYAVPLGDRAPTFYGSDQGCSNEGYFSVIQYQICNHPKCAGGR